MCIMLTIGYYPPWLNQNKTIWRRSRRGDWKTRNLGQVTRTWLWLDLGRFDPKMTRLSQSERSDYGLDAPFTFSALIQFGKFLRDISWVMIAVVACWLLRVVASFLVCGNRFVQKNTRIVRPTTFQFTILLSNTHANNGQMKAVLHDKISPWLS